MAASVELPRKFLPAPAWGLLALGLFLTVLPRLVFQPEQVGVSHLLEAQANHHFLVDINQAGVNEFQNLPTVGPALALRIVEFRKTGGPFQDVEDLLKVRGIGKVMIQELRPYLTVKNGQIEQTELAAN